MKNVDELYEFFLSSEEGKITWKEAYSNFPEHNTDEADMAADYIFDGFSSWLEDNLSLIKPLDFDSWVVTHGEEMYESIYAGLT